MSSMLPHNAQAQVPVPCEPATMICLPDWLVALGFTSTVVPSATLAANEIGSIGTTYISGLLTKLKQKAQIATAQDTNRWRIATGAMTARAQAKIFDPTGADKQLGPFMNIAGALSGLSYLNLIPSPVAHALAAQGSGTLAHGNTGGGGGGLFSFVPYPSQIRSSVFDALCAGSMIPGQPRDGILRDCRADADLRILKYEEMLGRDVAPWRENPGSQVAQDQRRRFLTHLRMVGGFMNPRDPNNPNDSFAVFATQLGEKLNPAGIVRLMQDAVRASYGVAALALSAREVDSLSHPLMDGDRPGDAAFAPMRNFLQSLRQAFPGLDRLAGSNCDSDRCLQKYIAIGSWISRPGGYAAYLAGMNEVNLAREVVLQEATHNYLLWKWLERKRIGTEITGVKLVNFVERQAPDTSLSPRETGNPDTLRGVDEGQNVLGGILSELQLTEEQLAELNVFLRNVLSFSELDFNIERLFLGMGLNLGQRAEAAATIACSILELGGVPENAAPDSETLRLATAQYIVAEERIVLNPHYDGGAGSGVSIGAGYDMGGRTAAMVEADLTRAGVPQETAAQIATCAGNRGAAAARCAAGLTARGLRITEAQGAALLANILPSYQAPVIRLNDSLIAAGRPPLTSSQIMALTSFCYNYGACGSSTAFQEIRNGNWDAAAAALLTVNTSGGRVLAGLTRRRGTEGYLVNPAFCAGAGE